MKLVVGLGNPGRKYEATRHNAGFELLAELSRRHGAPKPKTKFGAQIAKISAESCPAILVAPQTFMNASGRSVRQAVDFFRIPLENVLVVCDDMNLPLGKIRLRKSGSSGGHKGLQSIIDHLCSEEFPRLRMGIGLPPEGISGSDFVLRRFAKAESSIVGQAVSRSADAVQCWITQGIERAMNDFNVTHE